jgi:hypothetical protein
MTCPVFSHGDGPTSCGAPGDICQTQKVPISPAINLPLQIDEPEASALAPMPAETSQPTNRVPDRRMMAGRSHDGELFATPEKKDAIIDPYGKEAGTPLRVAQPQQP